MRWSSSAIRGAGPIARRSAALDAHKSVYNGIGEADFEPVPEGPNPVNFLYVGMLRDLKGPDLFVDAFAKAERILKRPLSAMMIAMVPIATNIAIMTSAALPAHQHGDRPCRSAKPSNSRRSWWSRRVPNPCPIIVLEALGAGKSVIASDVGGIAEVLGAGSAALVEPGHSDDLARVMAEAMSKPDWLKQPCQGMKRFGMCFSASPWQGK